jgi:hypothetical protein
VLPPGAPGTLPGRLFTAVLDFPDPCTINAFLLEAAGQLPLLRLESPLDAKGNGLLAVGPVSVAVHYAAADGWLLLLASESKAPDALHRLLAGLAPAGEHRMRGVESRLESGGQDAFLWLDVPRAVTLLEATGQQDQAAMLTALGASDVASEYLPPGCR